MNLKTDFIDCTQFKNNKFKICRYDTSLYCIVKNKLFYYEVIINTVGLDNNRVNKQLRMVRTARNLIGRNLGNGTAMAKHI